MSLMILGINYLILKCRDGNHGPEPQIWPVKGCRRMWFGRVSGLVGWVVAELGLLRNGTKRAKRDNKNPHFFFMFYLKNVRDRIRKMWFVWLSPRKWRELRRWLLLRFTIQALMMAIWASVDLCIKINILYLLKYEESEPRFWNQLHFWFSITRFYRDPLSFPYTNLTGGVRLITKIYEESIPFSTREYPVRGTDTVFMFKLLNFFSVL